MSSSISSSRPVRRFLLRIALPFLAVMIPGCWLFDGWFTQHIIFSTEPEGAAKLNRLFHNANMEEVVCIGNSRINNGLHPDSISPLAYNYGMNGASYILLEMAIRKELESKRRTPLIVGIDMNFFSNEVDNSVYAIPLYNESEEVREFMAEAGEGKLWHHVPTVRYFGHYEWYTQRYLSARRPDYTACGYVRGASICERVFDPKLLDKIKGEHKIVHPNTVYLKRFYEMIKSHPERDVVLARMPYHPRYYSAFTLDGNMDYFLYQISVLKNVTLLNFSDGRYPETCFTDLTHMNKVGAGRFSAEVRDSVLAHGLVLKQ